MKATAFAAEVSSAASRTPAGYAGRAHENEALQVVGPRGPLEKDQVARGEIRRQMLRGLANGCECPQCVLRMPLGAQARRGPRTDAYHAVRDRKRLPGDLHVAPGRIAGIVRQCPDDDDLARRTGLPHEIQDRLDGPQGCLPVVADERDSGVGLHGTHASVEWLHAGDRIRRDRERDTQRNARRESRQHRGDPMAAAQPGLHAHRLSVPSDGDAKAIRPGGAYRLAAQHGAVSRAICDRAAGELRSHGQDARIVRIENGDAVGRQ